MRNYFYLLANGKPVMFTGRKIPAFGYRITEITSFDSPSKMLHLPLSDKNPPFTK